MEWEGSGYLVIRKLESNNNSEISVKNVTQDTREGVFSYPPSLVYETRKKVCD